MLFRSKEIIDPQPIVAAMFEVVLLDVLSELVDASMDVSLVFPLEVVPVADLTDLESADKVLTTSPIAEDPSP